MTISTTSDLRPPESPSLPQEPPPQTSGGRRHDRSTVGTFKLRNTSPPTRQGLDSSPTPFLWESRTTSVDVMSVSNTARPVAVSSWGSRGRRRNHMGLSYGVRGVSKIVSDSDGQNAGIQLSDAPTATALEIRLNEARRAEHTRYLRRERHVFLKRLAREREERVQLEAWAALRLQAVFRGFLARPRPPRLRPRRGNTPEEANRKLIADLQSILADAGLPTIPGLGPDGERVRDMSEWGRGRSTACEAREASVWGTDRGESKRGRRPRSRKQKGVESIMTTRITKLVRGFLGRRFAERARKEWNHGRRLGAAVRMQRAWRAYRKRMEWRDLESGIMNCAALKVQARWRGVACRMELAIQRRQAALRERRKASAVTIQAAVRRRLAFVRYGVKLKLGAARRAREARAAAEAARPRRRWNRVSSQPARKPTSVKHEGSPPNKSCQEGGGGLAPQKNMQAEIRISPRHDKVTNPAQWTQGTARGKKSAAVTAGSNSSGMKTNKTRDALPGESLVRESQCSDPDFDVSSSLSQDDVHSAENRPTVMRQQGKQESKVPPRSDGDNFQRRPSVIVKRESMAMSVVMVEQGIAAALNSRRGCPEMKEEIMSGNPCNVRRLKGANADVTTLQQTIPTEGAL